ncbi:c-type cytochrome [Variovorax sp. PBL-E5]|uniref:c-type cytochrome n=1 Tax=Variovorax sp. PBL-E5 TaxID=434014 RepID=UPI001315F98F|nr:cytochrome c [Variovorax sp. PBL-E5]VTU21900.1 Cytochrome c552 [Variovorax sp. PBL-E5]
MSNETDQHRPPQERENAEPDEVRRPMPLIVAAVAASMVLFGAGYILLSDPFGTPGLGDRRTVAELSGPAPSARGSGPDGKQLFTANCVACHQATGKGLPGVFPPLDGSEWVAGHPRTVVNILLHGIAGELEVAGTVYKGAMPAFNQLSDQELAALATFIRSNWSNKAEPIKPDLFEQERKANPRTTPFAGGEELKALAAKTP